MSTSKVVELYDLYTTCFCTASISVCVCVREILFVVDKGQHLSFLPSSPAVTWPRSLTGKENE